MSTLTLPPGHTHWTQELADELLPDDVVRREVLDGELIVAPNAPSIHHQRLVSKVNEQLLRARPTGWEVFTSPLDVSFPWGDVAQPDIVVCAPDGTDETSLTGPPELVVEALSPSTRRNDLVRKRRLYERHGIGVYVIADPAGAVLTVLEHDEDGRLVETQIGTTVTLTRPFPVTLAI